MAALVIALLIIGGVATYYGKNWLDNREQKRVDRCYSEVVNQIAMSATRSNAAEVKIDNSPVYNGTLYCVVQERIIQN